VFASRNARDAVDELGGAGTFAEEAIGSGSQCRQYVLGAALPRLGHVDEIAQLLAFCVGDRAGYLTGTDILCDGGVLRRGSPPLKRHSPSPAPTDRTPQPSQDVEDPVLVA